MIYRVWDIGYRNTLVELIGFFFLRVWGVMSIRLDGSLLPVYGIGFRFRV